MNQTVPIITLLYDVMCDMKAHAINNDWEQVELADQRRKDVLNKLINSKTPLSSAEQETMQQILQLDQEVLGLATTERQKAAESLKSLSKQQTGCNAYQQNQIAK